MNILIIQLNIWFYILKFNSRPWPCRSYLWFAPCLCNIITTHFQFPIWNDIKIGCCHIDKNDIKVHSFLKQCFARSLVDIIWWYFQQMVKLISTDISWKYQQIVSSENCTKHSFKTEWSLVAFYWNEGNWKNVSFVLIFTDITPLFPDRIWKRFTTTTIYELKS